MTTREEAAERVARASAAVSRDPGPYHSTESAHLFLELEEALKEWEPFEEQI